MNADGRGFRRKNRKYSIYAIGIENSQLQWPRMKQKTTIRTSSTDLYSYDGLIVLLPFFELKTAKLRPGDVF